MNDGGTPEPVRRDEPYVWLTWLAPWVSGENSCDWAVWFQTNYHRFEKLDGGDFTAWRADHTRLRRETHQALNADGYRVKVENQNRFSARHEDSPAVVIGGTPDLLAFRDEDAIVLELKTGKQRAWHSHQVLLPMALLPRSNRAEYEETRFRGRLIYKDGSDREFSPREADELYERLPYFLNVLAGPEDEATRIPSYEECRYCPLGSALCPERLAPDVRG